MSRTGITQTQIELAALAPPRAAGEHRDGADRPRRPDAVAAVRAGALHLVVRHHAGRHGDVHHRLEISRSSAMAEIRVENLQQGLRRLSSRSQDSNFTVEDGEFFCPARPLGLRQDDDAAHDRRARTADRAARSCSAARTSPASAPRERDIAFVFQLFALYPHMNVRKNIGFPLRRQGMPRAEISAAGRGGGAASCASTICSTSRSRASPAATASAWRSAAPSCAGRRPS